jgi:ATP-dependent RNA helicase DDX27
MLQVAELVRLSLNHPVRLFVDSNTDVADNLRQEFVRIKTKKEGDREAIVTGMIATFDACSSDNVLWKYQQ